MEYSSGTHWVQQGAHNPITTPKRDMGVQVQMPISRSVHSATISDKTCTNLIDDMSDGLTVLTGLELIGLRETQCHF